MGYLKEMGVISNFSVLLCNLHKPIEICGGTEVLK